MGRAWNGDLLGVIDILDSDGLLIVPRRVVEMTYFRGRAPADTSPGGRVENLASANLQVLLGQRDAASFLLQPTPIRFEAGSL